MTKIFHKKRFGNKGYLKLAIDLLNGFSSNVFNRPYVTHSKSNMIKNLELRSKLIAFY